MPATFSLRRIRWNLIDLTALSAFVAMSSLLSPTFCNCAQGAPPAAQHAHPEKGPHGGPLLELGDEEYHVEAILDEKAGVLTLYVLDAAAREPVPIEAREVLINLKHGGKPVQFKLPASPLKTDPKDSASAFQLKSKELVHDLHHKNNEARLALKIKGKSYTTKFDLAHDHNHDH